MLLGEYFKKHFGKDESANGGTDGCLIGKRDSIVEIDHGRRSKHYPFIDGIIGKLPANWTVVENNICPPFGNNIVSNATALKVSALIEQAKEIHRQIAEQFNNEPEPPPPVKP